MSGNETDKPWCSPCDRLAEWWEDISSPDERAFVIQLISEHAASGTCPREPSEAASNLLQEVGT